MNMDEHTQNAIEIVSEGTKLTSQLILFILKSAVDMLENDKQRDKLVLNNSTKEGKQKINDLLKKHRGGIESLEGNLSKDQLHDYQKELKKLGVDFSIVKNGRDNYSFFFAGEQSNIIEKALKNVLEQKSYVLNDEKVKEAELDLNAEKYNFNEKEIDKVKNIYDDMSEKIILSDEEKNNILNEVRKLNITGINFDEVSAYDKGTKQEIFLSVADNVYGDGDIKVEVDKETGKSNVYKKNIDSENWSKTWYSLKRKDVDLNVNLKDLNIAKDNIEKEPVFQSLSSNEKVLINKMKNLDEIEKEVQIKIKNLFQELKNDISKDKVNVKTNEFNIDKENFYEEALAIQENYGFSSNKVEWENEKFLNYLKEVDPKEFEKFQTCKDIQNEVNKELSSKDKVNIKTNEFNIDKENFYEEALAIQENYGFSSNKVEWENEKFLNYLKEVDPKEFEKFQTCKDIQNEVNKELSSKDKVNIKTNEFNIDKENFYEEALAIQENYGFSSNKVEWENEKLLNYLKEVDPKEFEKFQACKDIQNEVNKELNNGREEILHLEEKQIEPNTKSTSKEILNDRLSQLDDKQLDLFTQRMVYEDIATSPVFDSTKTYLEANKLTEMQKDFPKETIQKINNLDSEIRNLNNFEERSDNPKLTAKEILHETKQHKKQRDIKREDKELGSADSGKSFKYSIGNVKKLDQQIKEEEKNKPVVRNKEQSL